MPFLFLGITLQCSTNKSEAPMELAASCFDNIQNGDEIGVDCGGTCLEVCNPVDESITIPDMGYITPTDYTGYSLIWRDEFNEEELDGSKWGYHLGDGCPDLCNWGNNEEQYFTDAAENIGVQQGNLIITARKPYSNGDMFTSSRIHTDNKFEFQYGRIDIRASMPSAQGTWVAMFLLNKEYSVLDPDAFWPSGGEIDIMEYLGENVNSILGTAHYGVDYPTNHFFDSEEFLSLNGDSFDEVYYVFSIIWEEDSITWLVNDIAYHSISSGTTSMNGQPYPFNDEFYFVFALSIGGNLPSTVPRTSDFPDNLIIDYVRVFQRN